MKIVVLYFLIIFNSYAQDIFPINKEKSIFRSAVEYSFDEILDDGLYNINFNDIKATINIIGHPGSGTHLIIDRNVPAFNNKNAISIFKKNNINVYHDKINKIINIKTLSGRKNQNIKTKIEIHVPMNINISGNIENGDVIISQIKGSIELVTQSLDATLKNVSGNIIFRNKGGNVDLDKVNGRIDLSVISGDVSLSGCNGDIKLNIENGNNILTSIKGEINSVITLGETIVENFDGTTATFNINVGNLRLSNSNANIEAKIDIGDIKIDKVRGNTNLYTAKGSINIKNIIGDNIARSNFGDINGMHISGKVNVITEIGNIIISKTYNSFLNNHDILLKTSRGSITLNFPSDLPYNIKAICENQNSKNSISSEIPLNEKYLPNKIIAEGKIKDGNLSCELFSNHGQIQIKTN